MTKERQGGKTNIQYPTGNIQYPRWECGFLVSQSSLTPNSFLDRLDIECWILDIEFPFTRFILFLLIISGYRDGRLYPQAPQGPTYGSPPGAPG